MIKNIVLAVVAVASVSAVALPAYAGTGITPVFGTGDNDDQDWVASTIVDRLNEQGVNATSVENWGGLIRAYVTLEDGSEVMQFYTPGSLNQVSL
ncbi:hypothetical protein [Devosia sp. SL43]|uniref:hypothetical protein n=1 Tax=Devosia sp. SL43 TaxID=2806348 RepID=UPI001F1BF9FB|nr:hypothetical protein [Devosia sp. SL43]UJW84418.1 hypothetical protein IM737_13380 [Devosia sp. SL43]